MKDLKLVYFQYLTTSKLLYLVPVTAGRKRSEEVRKKVLKDEAHVLLYSQHNPTRDLTNLIPFKLFNQRPKIVRASQTINDNRIIESLGSMIKP